MIDSKSAAAVDVAQLHAFGVVGNTALPLGHVEDLLRRDVDELGILVDEFPDEPRTRDPVDVGVLARDPFHI